MSLYDVGHLSYECLLNMVLEPGWTWDGLRQMGGRIWRSEFLRGWALCALLWLVMELHVVTTCGSLGPSMAPRDRRRLWQRVARWATTQEGKRARRRMGAHCHSWRRNERRGGAGTSGRRTKTCGRSRTGSDAVLMWTGGGDAAARSCPEPRHLVMWSMGEGGVEGGPGPRPSHRRSHRRLTLFRC